MATKKRGLGKGLSALLGDKPAVNSLINEKENIEEDKKGSKIEYILLDNIKTKADQPRKEFEKDALKELSNSIKAHGVIQPILLRKKGICIK